MKKFKSFYLLAALAALLMAPLSNAWAAYTTLTMFDHIYYDVGPVNSSDRYAVCGYWGGLYATYDWLPRGAVVVAKPNQSGVTKGTTAENMVITNQVKVIVIAGVGSSPLGALAMAKQAANILKVPVAGIVAGQGGYEMTYDAMVGLLNNSTNKYNSFASGAYVPNIMSSEKLYTLYSKGARPKLIIGHSKGTWDYINALWKMNNLGKASWYAGTKFVSFGMNGIVPGNVANFRAYIGSADLLGMTNFDSTKNLTWVPSKKHSLNRHALDSTLAATMPLLVGEGSPATAMPVEIYLPKAVAEMGVVF